MSQPCVAPQMYIPPAAQAALRADPDYLRLLEAESTWAFKYHLTRTNPWTPRAFPVQGLNNPAMGPGQVDAYNSLLPSHYRVKHRASQNRPQTELFGTAPYIALGRGIMHHVDVNSMLQQGHWTQDRGQRVLMEREFDRKHFVSIPAALRNLPFETRKGEGTRVSPEYLQPHD